MKKIGLALGVGGAPGLAHIGVIKALEEAHIPIHCVAGSSVGALVGGIYAGGALKEFEEYLKDLKLSDVLSQFDPALLKNGMFKGEKLTQFLDKLLKGKTIEKADLPFIAMASDLASGKEVRMKKGKIARAIRASIAIPGIFTTLKHGTQHLVDGGVNNPLPIDVVRQMGADIVIGVDLTKNYVRLKKPNLRRFIFLSKAFKYPTMMDAIEGSIFNMQSIITEKKLKEHPADILLNLKLTPIGFFEFHKSKKLIQQAYQQTQKIIPELKKRLKG